MKDTDKRPVSNDDFDRDTEAAQHVAAKEKKQTIAEALAMPGMEDIPFDPPRYKFKPRPVEFD